MVRMSRAARPEGPPHRVGRAPRLGRWPPVPRRVSRTGGLVDIETALAAVGAGVEQIIKWNLFVVEGQPIAAGFEAFRRFWGNRSTPPPLITAAFVTALGHPDWLAEMDAIAVVPA